MNYLVIGRDYADGSEKRQKQRPGHMELAGRMKSEGKLLYAVAMVEEGKMIGSVMIFNFSTEQEMEVWKKEEPYILGEVWEKVEIIPCAIPPLFSGQ